MAVLKCEWHLCVRVRKWVTAMGTVFMRVMPFACNCVVMRIGSVCSRVVMWIGSVCNYTKVGDVPV